MNEDLFTEESINALITWAESAQMPESPFQLSKSEYVENPKTFISTDLNFIKKNYRERLQLTKPAILRMNRLKAYLENPPQSN